MMRLMLLPWLVVGVTLLSSLLLSPLSFSLTSAHPALQVTPTAFFNYLPIIAKGWSPPPTPTATNTPTATPTPTVTPTPTSTPTNTSTLYLWSSGLLESQQSPSTGQSISTCYGPCSRAERWTASLTSDMVGNQYNLTGTFRFSTSGSYTVYLRFILAHQSTEQTLVEYPLALTSGTTTFYGFSQTGPDPTAVAGDILILEIDRRGVPGTLQWYFGGASGARVTVPALSTPTGTRFTGHTISSIAHRWVHAADMDRDGDIDVLTGESSEEVAWWENNGSQQFTKHIIASTFSGARSAHATDLDRDGDVDVLGAAFMSDEVVWWKNDGSQNFTKHVICNNCGSMDSIMGIDLDRDGDMDILAGGGGGGVQWWENDGSQNFTKHTIASNFYATSVYATDLDGDGDIDVLGATDTGGLAWWENDSSQNFTRHTLKAPGNTSTDGSSIFAKDMDGDGDIDIVSALAIDDDLSWWENDGNRNFTKRTIHSSFSNPKSVYAADLDGDGDMDLFAGGSATAWWENIGSQNFLRHTISSSGARSVYGIDVDRDGDVDFLATTSGLAWWENTGG